MVCENVLPGPLALDTLKIVLIKRAGLRYPPHHGITFAGGGGRADHKIARAWARGDRFLCCGDFNR
jgi:hypothetical protein